MLPVEAQAARRGADEPGMGEGGRHAVVLEAARGVHALVLQAEPAGGDARVAGHAGRGPQERLALADRDALFQRRKGQQLVEPPHAAEAVGVAAAGPFPLEGGERLRNRQPRPLVGHVQRAAAALADGAHFLDGVVGAAGRPDALLKSGSRLRNDRSLPMGPTSFPRSCLQFRPNRWDVQAPASLLLVGEC